MASIYARGGKHYMRVKSESGKWESEPAPFPVAQERQAKRYANEAQRAHGGSRTGSASTAVRRPRTT